MSILQRRILEIYILLFFHTDGFLTDSKNSQGLLDVKPNGVENLIDKLVH
jgi:hypothetical protein